MSVEAWIILGLSQALAISLLAAGWLWWRGRALAPRLAEFETRQQRASEAMQTASAEFQALLAEVEADDSASLKLELQQARTEIDGLNAQLASAEQGEAESDNELKALLQQFTRDSRDMLECIAGLERDNKALEDEIVRLGGERPKKPAGTEQSLDTTDSAANDADSNAAEASEESESTDAEPEEPATDSN